MRMWSLQTLLFTLCISLSGVTSAAGLILVSGYERGEVRVSCPYDVGYEHYEKYLCKNDCGNDDVLITTTERRRNKYSIDDDRRKRVFTTTISDLSGTDGGIYWCGVTKNMNDLYTEVKLEVGRDTCCDRTTKILSYEEASVSFSCSYDSKHLNSLKYICRGKQTPTCAQQALLTSNNQPNGRFTLIDDKESRQFTVTMTSLTRGDSGQYLCGVQLAGLDVFSAVELEVREWCCVKSNKLSAAVGHPVALQCPYPPQHRNNRKFLCKGDHRNNCTDMVTSQSRFTLQDDVALSSFVVTITELKAGDAGTYWCGSNAQWSVNNYTKIQLSVVFPQLTGTVIPTITVDEPVGSQSTHIEEATFSHPLVYILPAVLIILIFVLVIVYRYKCHKVQGAEVKMSRNKTNIAEAQDVVRMAEIYGNHDVVVCSKQSTYDHYDDTAQESDYQNFTPTDEIYCNQSSIHANR